jgi:hypothetical protein
LRAVLLDVVTADSPPPRSSQLAPQADYRSTSKRMAAMSSLEGTASPREPFQYRNTWRKLGVISDDFDYQYLQVLND